LLNVTDVSRTTVIADLCVLVGSLREARLPPK
jgi:hypothetical protein